MINWCLVSSLGATSPPALTVWSCAVRLAPPTHTHTATTTTTINIILQWSNPEPPNSQPVGFKAPVDQLLPPHNHISLSVPSENWFLLAARLFFYYQCAVCVLMKAFDVWRNNPNDELPGAFTITPHYSTAANSFLKCTEVSN